MDKDEYYHIYIQPIAASSGNKFGGQSFVGENQLELTKSTMQSPKVGKAPLRVLDLIRFNKDYKVYNNTIHFYNSLY